MLENKIHSPEFIFSNLSGKQSFNKITLINSLYNRLRLGQLMNYGILDFLPMINVNACDIVFHYLWIKWCLTKFLDFFCNKTAIDSNTALIKRSQSRKRLSCPS